MTPREKYHAYFVNLRIFPPRKAKLCAADVKERRCKGGKARLEICKSKKIFIVFTNTVYSCLYFGSSIYFHILPILPGCLGGSQHTAMPPAGKTAASLHKRAALCTAVAVYSVSLVLRIAFHAAHPGKRRVFCFRAILSLRSTRPRRAVVFGAHMAGIAAVDIRCAEDHTG